MTRFYSEYEIKKQDKQLNENLMLSTERFKDELKIAINADNHRSNVDRAKKKACSQYFDYDKFHQMVLGADLKGMKMDDVLVIKPEKAILNPLDDVHKFKGSENFQGNFVNDGGTGDIGIKDDMGMPLNTDEFTITKLNSEFKRLGKENY